MTRYRADNPLSSEEEAEADARAAEQEVEDWLADWSDDFNSDEYARSLDEQRSMTTPDSSTIGG